MNDALRDKIARAIFMTDYEHMGPESWEVARLDGNNDRWEAFYKADAVLAVLDLDKIRAEAQVKALREAASDARNYGHDGTFDFTDLNHRADRIAREAGIEQEAEG